MKHWSQEEIEYLRSAYAEGLGVESVSYALGRSRSAVYMMAMREKLTRKGVHWPDGAAQDATELTKQSFPKDYIRRHLLKTYGVTPRQASSIIANARVRIAAEQQFDKAAKEPKFEVKEF